MQKNKIINSNKVYLFSRLFVNNEYGAIGHRAKSEEIGQQFAGIFAQAQAGEITLGIAKNKVHEQIVSLKRGQRGVHKYEALSREVLSNIQSEADIRYLAFTLTTIMPEMNKAVLEAPVKMTGNFKRIVDLLHAKTGNLNGALFLALNNLEQRDMEEALEQERQSVLASAATLMNTLSNIDWITKEDQLVIFTGYIQECERRIGQKRKLRSGSSLSEAMAYTLKMKNVALARVPDSFPRLLPIEYWAKRDNVTVGISVTHNFRNVWDAYLCENHKSEENREYWHIVVNKRDAKSPMLPRIMKKGHKVFVPDQFYNDLVEEHGKANIRRMRDLIINELPNLVQKDNASLTPKERNKEAQANHVVAQESTLGQAPKVRSEDKFLEFLGFRDVTAPVEVDFSGDCIGFTYLPTTADSTDQEVALVYDASHMTEDEILGYLVDTDSNNVFVQLGNESKADLDEAAIVYPNFDNAYMGRLFSKHKVRMAAYNEEKIIEALGDEIDEPYDFYESNMTFVSAMPAGPLFVETSSVDS